MKQVRVRLNKSEQERVVTNFVQCLMPKTIKKNNNNNKYNNSKTIQKNVIVGLMTPTSDDKSEEQHAVHTKTYDYLQKIKENLNNMKSNPAPAAQ